MIKNVLICVLMWSSVINAQDYKFGKVSKEELQEVFYAKDSSAAAVVLYRSHKLNFEYVQGIGFKSVTTIHERVKIYNKNGFDYATKVERLYKSKNEKESLISLKAYTYNLIGGKIEKSKLGKSGIFKTEYNKYNDESKFTLPNIKEGSVVEYTYKIDSPFYYSIDEIPMQYDIPIKIEEVAINTPEYFVFKPSTKGYLMLVPEKSSGTKSINFMNRIRSGGTGFSNASSRVETNTVNYRIDKAKYTLKDVPALEEEPYVNDMDNYRSALNYELMYVQFPQSARESYTTTWEKVVKKIYDSNGFGEQLKISKYYKEDWVTILAGAITEKEKLAAIFSFVQNRMHWNNYKGFSTDRGVKKAYAEKTGNVADINLMLTGMLRKAGLKANPVLVSTRDHGVPLWPTYEGFNYVISAVDIEGETVLLDATNKYATPNLTPIRTLNWYGRIVKEDGTSSLLNLMPKNISLEKIDMMATLSETGELTGRMRKNKSNYYAYLHRNRYSDLTEENYLEKLENNEGGMEIEKYSIKNKEKIGANVIEDISFISDSQAEVIGDKIYFTPLFHFATTENVFKLEERLYPVDFAYPWQDKYSFTINIPQGYQVFSTPENAKVSLPEGKGSFKYQIIASGNKVQISASVQVNNAIIGAADYAELKQFYKMMVEKQTEKVVLSKI